MTKSFSNGVTLLMFKNGGSPGQTGGMNTAANTLGSSFVGAMNHKKTLPKIKAFCLTASSLKLIEI